MAMIDKRTNKSNPNIYIKFDKGNSKQFDRGLKILAYKGYKYKGENYNSFHKESLNSGLIVGSIEGTIIQSGDFSEQQLQGCSFILFEDLTTKENLITKKSKEERFKLFDGAKLF